MEPSPYLVQRKTCFLLALFHSPDHRFHGHTKHWHGEQSLLIVSFKNKQTNEQKTNEQKLLKSSVIWESHNNRQFLKAELKKSSFFFFLNNEEMSGKGWIAHFMSSHQGLCLTYKVIINKYHILFYYYDTSLTMWEDRKSSKDH